MSTEAETRKQLIDAKLREAGWDVENRTQVIQEFEINVPLPDGVTGARTPYEGHQYRDYVMLGKDGKLLPVHVATSPAAICGSPFVGRTSCTDFAGGQDLLLILALGHCNPCGRATHHGYRPTVRTAMTSNFITAFC